MSTPSGGSVSWLNAIFQLISVGLYMLIIGALLVERLVILTATVILNDYVDD